MSPKRYLDEAKHEAILKAASKLFLKNGYASTSMDKIAAEAGVTKQTVYAHFANKDALFSAMVTDQCTKHSPTEKALKNVALSVEDGLYQIGKGFLDMISSKEGLATHRLVMAESTRRPHLAELFFRMGPQRMNQILNSYLEALNARGQLSIPNTESAASYYFSMLKGRYHLRMALGVKPLPTRKELDEHIRETVRVFLHIYGGPNPLMTNNIMN